VLSDDLRERREGGGRLTRRRDEWAWILNKPIDASRLLSCPAMRMLMSYYSAAQVDLLQTSYL
jgi:hypothetical protein